MTDKNDVYWQLCDQINKLGFGFDHTPEEYELSLFRRFYTPEEAQWSLEMPLDASSPPQTSPKRRAAVCRTPSVSARAWRCRARFTERFATALPTIACSP